jgi:hypothetical protein
VVPYVPQDVKSLPRCTGVVHCRRLPIIQVTRAVVDITADYPYMNPIAVFDA